MKNSQSNGETQAENMASSYDDKGEPIFDVRSGIKTITASAIRSAPERAKTKGEEVLCCRIAGIVRGCSQVPSDPTNAASELLWVLEGEFIANSYRDEGVLGYRGEYCALPIFQNHALQAFQDAVNAQGADATLEFDLAFWAYPKSNPSGYAWRYQNLMPVAQRGGFLADDASHARLLAYRTFASQPGAMNDDRLLLSQARPIMIEHRP